jgi:hypothetical protein
VRQPQLGGVRSGRPTVVTNAGARVERRYFDQPHEVTWGDPPLTARYSDSLYADMAALGARARAGDQAAADEAWNMHQLMAMFDAREVVELRAVHEEPDASAGGSAPASDPAVEQTLLFEGASNPEGGLEADHGSQEPQHRRDEYAHRAPRSRHRSARL